MTSRGRTTSNQRWKNVVYVNVEIYNIDQRWNSVMFFNVELNNVRQRQNNVVIFNVDFHNVGQCRNNVANMTIWKNICISLDSKRLKPRFKNTFGLNIFLHFCPILTLSRQGLLSYRNQSIDLRSKSMGWFLYDNSLTGFYMATVSVMKGLREI